MKKTIFLLILVLFPLLNLSAQCLAHPSETSSMPANPVEVNGTFQFDYKIRAEVQSYTDGELYILDMVYYVNTTDNSMFFPKGFFIGQFGTNENTKGRIDGSVWLANGQMITYVYDNHNRIKRALTTETNQTPAGVLISRDGMITEWFDRLNELSEMPTFSRPVHDAEGFIAPVRSSDGTGDNKVTFFFNTLNVYDIKITPKVIGFLVGVVKDTHLKNCNRIIAYSKMEINGSRDYVEAELINITEESAKFDATDYKPMYMSSPPGSDRRSQIEDFKNQIMDKSAELRDLKEFRKMCSTVTCREEYDGRIESVKAEMDLIECKLMKTMGLGDTLEDCE